jgi:hypothetical protein
MNAPTNIRPRQLAQYEYTCWRLIGPAQPHPVQARTLQEVEAALATEANHGSTFLVLETDVIRETASLHVYRVRRGKWAGRYDGARKAYPHSADHLFSVPVKAFEPVEPWRYVPGCDVVGRSSVIEGARHG